MLSHTSMDVPYEYTHMGHPIRVWAIICIWGRTFLQTMAIQFYLQPLYNSKISPKLAGPKVSVIKKFHCI